MALISASLLNPNPNLSFKHRDISTTSNFLQSQLFSNVQSTIKIRSRNSRRLVMGMNPVGATHSFDVVVVGAGIIGLTIARQFLLHSPLSVAVVDAAVPCSGATGAGQGYLWMTHKKPGTGVFDLALRSQKLWQFLADSLQDQCIDPSEALGWMKTGSLVVGTTEAELTQLNKQVQQLCAAGLRAEYLSGDDLALCEPELGVSRESGAAFLPDDCQLDAHRTVAFIEKGNRLFASQARYAEFYHDPAVCLLRSNGKGVVEGIKTKNNTLYGQKAIIIAAGCWTGSLMRELLRELDTKLKIPVQPRKAMGICKRRAEPSMLDLVLREKLDEITHVATKGNVQREGIRNGGSGGS